MKRFLLFVMVTFYTVCLSAQTLGQSVEVGGLNLFEIRNSSSGIDPSVKGTPFMNKEFLPATIAPLNRTFSVRYNAYNDNMQVLTNGNILVLDKTNKKYVIRFAVGNLTYKIIDLPDEKSGFVVVLNEGEKVNLYKKQTKIFIEKKVAAYASLEDRPATFKDARDKYFVVKDGVVTKIKLKKKSILKLFPDSAKELKKYIKKSKLNLSKEKDVVKLFKHINNGGM